MPKRKTWRCFFCDDVFMNAVEAAEHFGGNQLSLAGCQIKGHENHLLRVIREQEAQLVSYRLEDTALMRALYELRAENSEAVRRAEEIGFNRGVVEMQSLARQQFGKEIIL